MLEIDTIGVTDKSNQMNQKINEFNILVNKFYAKINNMPTNKIWIGPRANDYIKRLMLDKSEILGYSNNLKELTKEIGDFSEKMNLFAKSLEGDK